MLLFIALVILILYCLNDSNKLYAKQRNYYAEHPPHWEQEEYMLCCEALHDNIVANDPQTVEEMIEQMHMALLDGKHQLWQRGFLPTAIIHLTPGSEHERQEMEHALTMPAWERIMPLQWPPSVDRMEDLTVDHEQLQFTAYLAKALGIRFRHVYDQTNHLVWDDDDIERKWEIFKEGYFQRIIDAEDQYQAEVQDGTWSFDYDELIDQAIQAITKARQLVMLCEEKILAHCSPAEVEAYQKLPYDDFRGRLRILETKAQKYHCEYILKEWTCKGIFN